MAPDDTHGFRRLEALELVDEPVPTFPERLPRFEFVAESALIGNQRVPTCTTRSDASRSLSLLCSF
jgi:hypothetical protein